MFQGMKLLRSHRVHGRRVHLWKATQSMSATTAYVMTFSTRCAKLMWVENPVLTCTAGPCCRR